MSRILNVSPRWIDDQLAKGTMQPQPMPRGNGKWQWSKAVLQKYVDGGYLTTDVRRARKVSPEG